MFLAHSLSILQVIAYLKSVIKKELLLLQFYLMWQVGDETSLLYLIQQGCNMSAEDKFHNTALHLTAQKDRLQATRVCHVGGGGGLE